MTSDRGVRRPPTESEYSRTRQRGNMAKCARNNDAFEIQNEVSPVPPKKKKSAYRKGQPTKKYQLSTTNILPRS